jgi:hypothetical protein
MKKFILLYSFVLIAILNSFGQNPNEVFSMRIAPFTYVEPSKCTSVGSVLGTLAEAASGQTSNNRHPEVVPYIEAVVKTAFSDVRRLAPVEGEGQFSLTGDVVNVTTWTKSRTTESKDSKGKVVKTVHTDYYASVTTSLTLLDNATGQTWTQKFTGGGGYYYYKSEAAAIEAALNIMQGRIVKYYNNLFPLYAQIVERGSEKKDKMNQVYIDLGSDNGLFKGVHFNVSVVGEAAGRTTEHKIGKIKVEEVQGSDISLCKVEKGKKEIKEALDNGQTLTITSID